ncbi:MULTISPECIES: hypothetical protein [Clostridium]|uniref:hypothetical protein n=1 Tax=Clostridium TaxID=1485 RepID=UPI001586EFBB|nr:MULTISPECIES: hypothetical protein [Clostridium]
MDNEQYDKLLNVIQSMYENIMKRFDNIDKRLDSISKKVNEHELKFQKMKEI